jgi:hypothetical protein
MAETLPSATSDPAAAPPRRMTVLRTLARHWGAWLGLAVAVLSVWDLADGVIFADIIGLAAFGYLLLAVLDRRSLTWPLVLLLTGAVVLLRAVDVTPAVVLAAAAAVLAVAGIFVGHLRRSRLHLLQSPLAVVFGAAAVTATLVSVEAGSYVVAAGLIAHAALDVVLWRADRVVARSFAEWCAVFDVVVGVGIVAVMLG